MSHNDHLSIRSTGAFTGRDDRLARLGGSVAVIFRMCSMPQDYYSSLANLVRSSATDDAHKRRAIYALARSELRQFLARQGVIGSARTLELHGLEAAIERIEFELEQSRERALTVVVPSIEILPPEDHRPTLTEPQYEPTISSRRPTTHLLLSLVGAAILVIITYLVVERGLHDGAPSAMSTSPSTVDAGQPTRTARIDHGIPNTKQLMESMP